MKKLIQFPSVFVILFLTFQMISCDSGGSGGGDSIEVIKKPDLTSIFHRELVNMAAKAGVSGSYLTDDDGTSSYIQSNTTPVGYVHNITPFEIGKYEITYELWYTVRIWAEANGYTFAYTGKEGNNILNGSTPTEISKLEPVTYISWRDAIVWCNAYSELTDLTPCYYTDNTLTTILRTSSKSTTILADNGDIAADCVNWSANGYRLPTEGEWQYAASCAATYPYYYASGADAVYDATTGGSDVDGDGDVEYSVDVAWYLSNSDLKTHSVGAKSGNRYGLFDMSGNVKEWCWDWYGSYPDGIKTDYKGYTITDFRVIRGGAYGSNYASSLSVGYRDYYYSYGKSEGIGFRVVRRP